MEKINADGLPAPIIQALQHLVDEIKVALAQPHPRNEPGIVGISGDPMAEMHIRASKDNDDG